MLDSYPSLESLFPARLLYVRVGGEIVDPTAKSDHPLQVHGPAGRADLSLKDDLPGTGRLLQCSVFAAGQTAVVWDMKAVAAYFLRHGRAPLAIPDTAYDLKTLEAFRGVTAPPPETWADAVRRAKACLADPAAVRMHAAVHRPLAARVLPGIESAGLLDRERARSAYPRFDIEGQTTGRLRCTRPTPTSFNPHSLGPEDRDRYRPAPPHDVFLSFDYRNMEVTVLQWLSGDPALGKLLKENANDVYSAIYTAVTGFGDDADAREKGKRMFLPVVYGQGPASLADSLGVSEGTARAVIGLIEERFPVALGWVADHHRRAAESGNVTDYLGRVRAIPDEPYKARQMAVAAPAAAVCLEKLIALYDALPPPARLVFSVHDGYVVVSPSRTANQAAVAARAALEAPSTLLPGLRLPTSLAVGKTLNGLKKIY
jgi:hypothetical protein